MLLCLLACQQTHRNPCGPGMKPSAAEDRCIPEVDASQDPAEADNGGKPGGNGLGPDSRKDAGQVAPIDSGENPAMDAGAADPDAGAPVPPPVMMVDAGKGDAGSPDAGSVDAGTDAGGKDAGLPDAALPPVCSDSDFDAWQAFHLSDQMVAQIVGCSKKLRCKPGKPCALDGCLREASGVQACESCTSGEVTCVANNCQQSCSVSDQECRACACAAGCIEQFESCAERSLEVCSSCEAIAGQCGGGLLSPELIMVIVSPLF